MDLVSENKLIIIINTDTYIVYMQVSVIDSFVARVRVLISQHSHAAVSH